jgi:acyl transferase domain-containing protein
MTETTRTDDPAEFEKIAIVGLAGRFPGAPDLGRFWSNLRDGVESISFFTDEDLTAAGVSAADLGHPAYVKAGAEVAGVDLFDADFFGYTAREAEIMDPQHRLFLETAWEALEHAGYDNTRLDGRVGVFGGASTNSAYLPNVFSNLEAGAGIKHQNVGLGNELGYLTTRVSFKLDLTGPSVPVSTACSTSLVAVHLACQSLLGYECDMAVAGASAFKSLPGTGYLAPEGSVLSPDGHCRPFDAGARGTIFGSGAGVVVVKRLSDAIAAGDTVYAVIRGSAVNNDGADKASFTAPSVDGQARVVTEALANAGVTAESIGYVEAHGTATVLGDPIELRALTKAYRQTSDEVGFCALGSVKSNVGHLDAAAGMAGLLKTVLSLWHGWLPPSLNYRSPNPEIDFAAGPFRMQERLTRWERSDTPRRAGVSAFGFGGTNAHVVVEEAPVVKEQPTGHRGAELLVLSARSEAALEEMTDRVGRSLRTGEPALADVAFTLARGRRVFPFRRIVVGDSGGTAADALETRDPGRVLTGRPGQEPPGVAFLFSGQGAQYPGMAHGLYEREPVFRRAVNECLEVLGPTLAGEVRAALLAERTDEEMAGRLRETRLAQPALFIVEYALAELWRSWGVVPRALLGHSLGELVAACIAGVFSLADALSLVVLRGRLMQDAAPGAMLSVAADRETVMAMLPSELSLAAHNGPKDCVVSGPQDAVDAFVDLADTQGLAVQPVASSHAFHSSLMTPVVGEFVSAVSKVERAIPGIPFVSNITGTWITDEQAQDPRYWGEHVLACVEFAAGVRTVTADPGVVLVEVGPGQTLGSLARRLPGSVDRLVISSLPHRRDRRGDVAALLRAAGQLWLAGVDLEWAGYFGAGSRKRVALPTYPFQRRRYWLDPVAQAARPDTRGAGAHPLLDQALVMTMGEAVFATEFSVDRHWVLNEHKLLGQAIVPGTTYLEMSRAAVEAYANQRVTEITDVDFLVPLHVPDDATRQAHTRIRELDHGTFEFTIVSRDPDAGVGQEWMMHARGQVSTVPVAEPPVHDVAELRDRCRLAAVDVGGRQADHEVMRFGPRWQESLRTVDIGVRAAIGRLDLPAEQEAHDAGYTLHPALLDLATGFSGLAVLDHDTTRELAPPGSDLFLPVGYDRLRIHGPIPAHGYSFVQPHEGHEQSDQVRKTDVLICDEDGRAVVEITGFTNKRVTDPKRTADGLRRHARHHTVRWTPVPALSTAEWPAHVLVIQDNEPQARPLVQFLRGRGVRVVEATIATAWHRAGADDVQLPPTESGFTRLLSELGERWPSHIVYVAASTTDDTHGDLRLVNRQLEHGVHGLARLAKVLTVLGQDPVRLSVVAPYVGRVTGAEPRSAPVHSALFGLAKVIGQENSDIECRCVDVAEDTEPGMVCAEVVADAQPGVVAVRGGQRYVAELVGLRLGERPPAPPITPGGVYLITGGLGGLGLRVAKHFAELRRGVRLALVGRTALPPRKQWPSVLDRADSKAAAQVAAVLDLEACGAQVRCYGADVADLEAMTRAVDAIRAKQGRIACVVHAAGVAGDGFLVRKDHEVFTRTLAPKVAGTTLLDVLTANDPPDLMVMFGSTTALFGSAGQGDYTAANAYLDGFAEYRNALGRRTVSVGWTDWLETGMAFDHGVARDQGFFRSISVDDALSSLDELIEAECAHVVVGEINYPMLAMAEPGVLAERMRRSPLALSAEIQQAIGATRGQGATSAARTAATNVSVRLTGRDSGDYSETEWQIGRIWAAELGLAELNVFESSFDLGGNSLIALRIAQTIERTMGVRVRMAELFRYVTVAELSEYLDGTK